MKKVFIIAALISFAAMANAAQLKTFIPFSNTSGASAKVSTSAAYNVSQFPLRTIHVSGQVVSGTAYKNMSGTLIAQCAPTSGGPWSTCIANGYAQTAISKTTDGSMTWKDASPWVRLKWTAGAVKTQIKAWFYALAE